ncbi:MAG: fibronectin type III domain-containing protein [Gammaproteobacteria bacterium]|nr:fibronectin type III domain-containing protein [Gammaproteobacteria bacterium]
MTKISFILIIIAALVTGCGGGANAHVPNTSNAMNLASVKINWQAPTDRIDGSAFKSGEISGYKLYYGTTDAPYSNAVSITDPAATQYMLVGVRGSVYYVAMTVVDQGGNESQFSNQLQVNL